MGWLHENICAAVHFSERAGDTVGLAGDQTLGAVLLAIPKVLFKIFCFLLVLVVIESSLSKLRLFRISEFLGAAFITSVAAMIARVFLP